jgi:polysaccharide export outer membrane protein
MAANPLVSYALVVLVAAGAAAQAAAQVTNYVVGPQDQLLVTVWEEQALSGKFTVEADGSFSFPLIGRVQAGGLTLRSVEDVLKSKLAAGYLREPQVSVAVEQYRSQRLYVVGEVRNPGSYPLTGEMTLIEALARAGSATPDASGEVLIVRSRPGEDLDGPVLPDQRDAAEVIHVDLADLQSGVLPRNVSLRDNDTVFVPRAQLIYVFGQVRTPGAYALKKGTTVLQALSLAGGVSDRGATGRIRIVRLVGDKKMEVKAQINDVVEAGDTIMVPERFF